MKKIFSLLILSVFLGRSIVLSQSFSFFVKDTIKYSFIGDELICYDSIFNTSSSGYWMDVVRVENDTAPGWKTAFCLDLCNLPEIDSVRFYILPNEHQMFRFHFYSGSSAPDSSTALMKFKNVSNPSNVFYQRFYGITSAGFAVNELFLKDTEVKIFPSPVIAGNSFCINIKNQLNIPDGITLSVFNSYGNKVAKKDNLVSGNNHIALDLPDGIYPYLLSGEGAVFYCGKIILCQ